MPQALHDAIDTYLAWISKSTWVRYELYKFEFAHELYDVIDWARQSDEEVLALVNEKLKRRYSETAAAGVNFLQSAARYEGGKAVDLHEVAVLRKMAERGFEEVAWDKGVATYNALSCWSAILMPGGNYPVYASNHEMTFQALFPDEDIRVGSSGVTYVKACQPYLERIHRALEAESADQVFRQRARSYYAARPTFAFDPAREFRRLDWNFLTEDFMYFQERFESWEHTAFEDWDRGRSVMLGVEEGARRLVTHMQRERVSGFAAKAKNTYLMQHPHGPCEACRASMGKVYPTVGEGYLEAHHIEPLGLREASRITKDSDFAFLCANCHRMIHRLDGDMSVARLREIVNSGVSNR